MILKTIIAGAMLLCRRSISMRLRVAVCAIFVITPLMGAEQAEFETASVKPADRCIFNSSVDPGRVAFNGHPLKSFLSEALK
jgi:hypothetical protein